MEEIIKYLEEIKKHQMQTVQLARSTEVYKLADKALAKALLIPVVVGQSEQLKPKPQICYKSNELCKYDCSGLCKESC